MAGKRKVVAVQAEPVTVNKHGGRPTERAQYEFGDPLAHLVLVAGQIPDNGLEEKGVRLGVEPHEIVAPNVGLDSATVEFFGDRPAKALLFTS